MQDTNTARIIAPEEFHKRFRAHWERTLGNVYTRKLAEQWYDLALTFNAHIEAANDDKAEEQYSVLAAPLGSGKTQGAVLYAVMLAERYGQEMPGVLIVTRRIADADAIEKQVNEMAGKQIAKAYHWVARKERGARLEDLPQYPVLIVTHVAYQDALDALWHDGMSKWPDFCRYGEGSRALCVIDEAIDLVTHDSVGADRLRVALGYIPRTVRVKFPEAIAALNDTQAHLDSEERLLVPGQQHAVLHRMIRERKLEDLNDLLGELGCTRLRDCGDEQGVKKGIGDTLRGVERIWRQWSYLGSLPNGDRALHTARLILPPHTKGAVILDATSNANAIYELFGNRIIRRKQIAGVRSWKNVTLHVSRGHRVGKSFVQKEGDVIASEGIAEVRRAVREGRKVLYVGHKDLEPFLVKHGIPRTDVAHWGEIDGSNAWRDFDVVAILTIFYRPDWWAPNTIFALNGEVDPDVLGPEGDALRWKLMRGQLVSDIVQAIGRVRCRKVVDADGNCRPTDVFLKLPSGARGEELLQGIVDELPGVRVVEWAYEGTATKTKVPASQVAEALVLWCSRLPQGRTSSKRAREELGIAAITWKRLVVALKDPVSDISKRLAELGVGFFAGVKGSHQAVAAFVRL